LDEPGCPLGEIAMAAPLRAPLALSEGDHAALVGGLFLFVVQRCGASQASSRPTLMLAAADKP